MRNGSVTPREKEFAKQMQIMLLGRWSAEDMAQSDFEIGVKLEPWLRRYSGIRCLTNIVEFPTDLMPG